MNPEIKITNPDFYISEPFACRGSLPKDSKWWNNVTFNEEVDIKEDGESTFAVFDLMVHSSNRGKGFGKIIHDSLLAGGDQKRVTLLSSECRKPAYNMWKNFGYKIVGTIKEETDSQELSIFVKTVNKVG